MAKKADKKRDSSKRTTASKSVSKKRTAARSRPSAKPRAKAVAKTAKRKKATSRPSRRKPKVESSMTKEITREPEPLRLLTESRATTAALVLLERAIKLLYHKEIKKARAELNGLIEHYPGESEILARARMYLQICDREDPAQKRQASGRDQLYTMGVMEHNRGDYERAIAYFKQSLEKNPDSDHVYYCLAASCALQEDVAGAVLYLRKAVELNEDNRIFAKNDADFSGLFSDKDFCDLICWSQITPGEQP